MPLDCYRPQAEICLGTDNISHSKRVHYPEALLVLLWHLSGQLCLVLIHSSQVCETIRGQTMYIASRLAAAVSGQWPKSNSRCHFHPDGLHRTAFRTKSYVQLGPHSECCCLCRSCKHRGSSTEGHSRYESMFPMAQIRDGNV